MSRIFIIFSILLASAASKIVKRQVPQGCGQRKVNTQGLIVSGYATSPGEWPWHTAIFHLSGAQRTYACGGTLINDFQVVTAAHCVVDGNTGESLYPEVLLMQLGAYDLSIISQNAVERKGFKIEVHRQYIHNRHTNDIALVTMQSKVKFSEYIQPACIWNDDINKLSKQGIAGTAVGWGITENDKTSTILKAATLPVVSFQDCLDSNRAVFGQFLSDGMFCAGYRNGTTVCNGDSGGGLFINYRHVWYLAGIVSFSALRDYGQPYCSTNDYSVFVNVPKYHNWIQNPSNPQASATTPTSGGGGGGSQGSYSGSNRKCEQKCREYETKGIAASTKTRNFVSKAQLYTDTDYVSDGHFISERFVITPANENFKVRPNQVKKSKGKVKLNYIIRDITFHPEYVHGLLDNDLALVRLGEDGQFSGWSKIMCLYASNLLNPDSLVSDYRDQKVRIANDNTCENRLKSTKKYLINDIDSDICTNICLSRELAAKIPSSESTHLVALPSYCEGEGEGVGVYTRLYSFMDWIESVVWP